MQTMIFVCRACGHQFQSFWDVVAKQPTCPRCRTYGRIAGPDGAFVSAKSVPAPRAAGGPVRARPPARQGPDQAQPDYVTVRGDTVYGTTKNSFGIVAAIVLPVVGLLILAGTYFYRSSRTEKQEKHQQQQKEVVMDPREFERAIDEAIGNVQKRLETVPGAKVQRTTDFRAAFEVIRSAGGTTPNWTDAPKPGQPFKAAGFVITGEHAKGRPDGGFVMLLYYKTVEEVQRAGEEMKKILSFDPKHYSITKIDDIWYLAYSGVAWGGVISDTVNQARSAGQPTSFKQFNERVRSSYRGG